MVNEDFAATADSSDPSAHRVDSEIQNYSMAPGARISDKPSLSSPRQPGKAGKASKPPLIIIPNAPPPPVDPKAPSAAQICGCPNTVVNAYAQNLMKLHLEDERDPVVRRKTLGPMAMAAIEAKRAKRSPHRLVRFCNCHETVAECHKMLIQHQDDHRLTVRTHCGGCNSFTRLPRLPIEHSSTDYCGLAKPKRSCQKFGGQKKRYFMYMQSYAVAPLKPLQRKFWHW